MACRYIVLSALLVTLANAGLLPVYTPVYKTAYAPLAIQKDYALELHEAEHYAPAHYHFSYDVHDPHSGDIKSQQESRKGDRVEGQYSLVEPDGHIRTVKYTADKHSGFNAIVERTLSHRQIPHPQTIKLGYQHQPLTLSYH